MGTLPYFPFALVGAIAITIFVIFFFAASLSHPNHKEDLIAVCVVSAIFAIVMEILAGNWAIVGLVSLELLILLT